MNTKPDTNKQTNETNLECVTPLLRYYLLLYRLRDITAAAVEAEAGFPAGDTATSDTVKNASRKKKKPKNTTHANTESKNTPRVRIHDAIVAEDGVPHLPGGSGGWDADAAAATAVSSGQEEATFESLGLCDWLLSACKAMGFRRPTPVQRYCIPAVSYFCLLIARDHYPGI